MTRIAFAVAALSIAASCAAQTSWMQYGPAAMFACDAKPGEVFGKREGK